MAVAIAALDIQHLEQGRRCRPSATCNSVRGSGLAAAGSTAAVPGATVRRQAGRVPGRVRHSGYGAQGWR